MNWQFRNNIGLSSLGVTGQVWIASSPPVKLNVPTPVTRLGLASWGGGLAKLLKKFSEVSDRLNAFGLISVRFTLSSCWSTIGMFSTGKIGSGAVHISGNMFWRV